MVQESSGFNPNRLLDSGGYNWPRVKPYFGAGQATDQLPKTSWELSWRRLHNTGGAVSGIMPGVSGEIPRVFNLSRACGALPGLTFIRQLLMGLYIDIENE